MKVTYVNTTQMHNIGTRINSYATQYENLVNALFRRMLSVPTSTNEWVGHVAQDHANKLALEKSDYINFAKRIKEFGNKIISDADAYDNKLKANKVEEGQ